MQQFEYSLVDIQLLVNIEKINFLVWILFFVL